MYDLKKIAAVLGEGLWHVFFTVCRELFRPGEQEMATWGCISNRVLAMIEETLSNKNNNNMSKRNNFANKGDILRRRKDGGDR